MEYIKAKQILYPCKSGNKWFGIDYNMNLYQGCLHGCIYCDSRSSCYKIDNFDKVRIKENCIEILNEQLKSKRKKGVIGIGAMSDTYNPFEKKYNITRQALELIDYYGFGVSIDTKSDLIIRDIDLLKKISKKNPVIIKLTITTADDNLSRVIEPNVCVSSKRFEAIKLLSDNGIYTGVLFTPILPYITDSVENVEKIARLSYESGAKFIYSIGGVTLRDNQRDYYFQKLDKYFPNLKEKYIKEYRNSYYCKTKNKKVASILKRECDMYKIKYKMDEIIKDYKKYNNDLEQIFFDLY